VFRTPVWQLIIIKNVTDTPPPLDESQPFFESPQIIRHSFPALSRKKSATSKKSMDSFPAIWHTVARLILHCKPNNKPHSISHWNSHCKPNSKP